MSALSDVIAGIRKTLSKSGEARTLLRRALDLLNEADQELTAVLRGSNDPEATRALALLAHTRRCIEATYQASQRAENLAEAYLNRLGPDSASSPAESRPPQASLDGLRTQLPGDVPPPEQRTPGTPRPKTHGRWFAPDGQVRSVVSGEDELYPEAVRAFTDLGLRRMPVRASDVEMKLAAYMRNHGIRTATVVINNTPCTGPFGCDALVPVLLPDGCTLTVHGANDFTKTYRGGVTPPWRTH